MPGRGKTLPIAGQPAISAIGLAPKQKDCHHYDIEWLDPPEATDAEVSRLVNGGTAPALRNPKRWRNSTSSGYSSHSPPLSAGSYSTCCAAPVQRNCGPGAGEAGATALGLAVIHEAETIPRPIWPCASPDPRELHLIGYETCEGLPANCSYTRAYTYASPCCRNDCYHHHLHHQPVPTAHDVLVELSRTLNSVIDGESGMTPEEILRDISRTVAIGIDSATGVSSTGVSDDQVYRLSSSSSSGAGCRESVNPVNLKVYGKKATVESPPALGTAIKSYHCAHEAKRLLLQSVKTEDDRRKQLQQVPAVFLVPRCSGIYPQTLLNYGSKSVMGSGAGDGRRLMMGSKEDRSELGDKCKRNILGLEGSCTKPCYISGEPVYSTLDPSDESSSYGAVGKAPIKSDGWNQGITPFSKSLDFTLDGARAERLGRTIARAKRRRQWCRAITAIFGLVFFILSVVVVSMSVTRGRKVFGSM